MTEHPLTFQDVAEISKQRLLTMELCDDMRAAADWQLEQAIEWMKDHNTQYIREDSMGIYFDDEKCIDDFKKAMRPQENNS